MRIARPLLLVMTPVGVGWGLVEAARFHWWLAALMAVLLGVVGLFVWGVVRRISAERHLEQRRISAERTTAQPPVNARRDLD